ncbi:malonate decarboxylase holo-ACP synthase [Massilia luteola]|uniref:malonate decarboxylase holo-ACP synthase n=1 Tax=Massilia luteola TaxID=3081751 RepID=UPI002ACC36F3|nr:malonate decarboxylase holo-ACP synthase [Massilia sp. Gc5]
MPAPRPHDLLFTQRPGAFAVDGVRPDWLDPRAPLVVRREATRPGIVPAGARGLQRNERCKGRLALDAVASVVTPRMLAAGAHTAASDLPCIVALRALAPRLDALGVDWGPTGGAGYWLACGLPVLRATSDLDLLVRLPRRPAGAVLAALSALRDGQPCRIDIQVDTGGGGFALAEYARGGRVLLKTDAGPRLVDDPWEAA